MDDLDRRIITLLSEDIPVTPDPFGILAETAGVDRAEFLLRLGRLRHDKLIRGFRAFFDLGRLGYRSSTAAMRIEESLLAKAADVLRSHPGITHVYQCDHTFNLWFLLTVADDQFLSDHFNRLHELVRASETVDLHVLGVFDKEKGFCDLTGRRASVRLTPREMAWIRALREDMPMTDRPFRQMARAARMEEADLLRGAEVLKSRGIIKRFGADFFSEAAKVIDEQPMIVWSVPEEREQVVAEKLLMFREVQTLVKRMAYPDFPYGLHMTVRDCPADALPDLLADLQKTIGPWPCRVIRRIYDYGKARLRILDKDLEHWLQDSETAAKIEPDSRRPGDLFTQFVKKALKDEPGRPQDRS